VANLSRTVHINFYQNRSSIVEVTTKKFGVFLCPTVQISLAIQLFVDSGPSNLPLHGVN